MRIDIALSWSSALAIAGSECATNDPPWLELGEEMLIEAPCMLCSAGAIVRDATRGDERDGLETGDVGLDVRRVADCVVYGCCCWDDNDNDDGADGLFVESAIVRKEETESKIATSLVLRVVAASAEGIELENLKSKSFETVFVSSAIEMTD